MAQGHTALAQTPRSAGQRVPRHGDRDRAGMIEAIVDSIRVNLVTQNRVLFLREVQGDRHLPIWIGEFEAQAIVLEMQGMTPQRPLPYDLLMTMLGELDARVARVVVNDLSHDIYYARIVVERAGETFEIDSRPSDAIAVAVRAHCPIFVDDTVMDRAGVNIADDDSDEAPEGAESEPGLASEDEGLTIFRDFINTLDIDDLDTRSN
jgi:bifunctional DNase/RNase